VPPFRLPRLHPLHLRPRLLLLHLLRRQLVQVRRCLRERTPWLMQLSSTSWSFPFWITAPEVQINKPVYVPITDRKAGVGARHPGIPEAGRVTSDNIHSWKLFNLAWVNQDGDQRAQLFELQFSSKRKDHHWGKRKPGRGIVDIVNSRPLTCTMYCRLQWCRPCRLCIHQRTDQDFWHHNSYIEERCTHVAGPCTQAPANRRQGYLRAAPKI
jgi:hypothetical protein